MEIVINFKITSYMKKLLFGVISLLLMASCAGRQSSEDARKDSIRRADSIALIKAEATRIEAEEAAKAAAEQARLDSIRQDSIKSREKLNNFNLKHLTIKWEDGAYLKDFKDIKSFLTKEGFKIASKKKEKIYYDSDGETETWTPDVYTFIRPDIEIKVFSNCNDCPISEVRIILSSDEIKDKILSNTLVGMKKRGTDYYFSGEETDVVLYTKGKTIYLKNTI